MSRALVHLGALISLALGAGCGARGDDPPLSAATPNEPVIAAPDNGPPLTVVSPVVAVHARPDRGAPLVGGLHAGARVIRSPKPLSTDGCPAGWYAVKPRGVVCASDGVALDEAQAPGALAKLMPVDGSELPYTYVKTRTQTSLVDLGGSSQRPAVPLAKGSYLAISGQAKLADAEGRPSRYAMTPQGMLVPATDIEQVREPALKGIDLEGEKGLPVGFVVREGISTIELQGKKVEKHSTLQKHTRLPLTGKAHMRGNERYWGLDDGTYVRHRDVTIIPRRDKFPEFVKEGVRWIDVAVVTGALVLYEGKKPIFATVVSLGSDRAGGTQATQLGQHTVTGKWITASQAPAGTFDTQHDVRDVPWVIELSNGQKIHAAVWHERFGLEYGPGNIQLAPADAARVFKFVEGEVPQGWHGVALPPAEQKTIVLVRR